MHWEIQQGSDVAGPFSEDEILMMVEAGRVDRDTMVRPEGKTAWKPATRHGRFAAALRSMAARDAEDVAPGAAPARRPPIDGVPFKDPARWDQQTQLGMPVATLVSLEAPPPPAAEPTTPATPRAERGAAATPRAGRAARATPRAEPGAGTDAAASRLPAPAQAARVEPGLLHALFDVSFTRFVTTRVVQVLFAVHVVVVLCALVVGVTTGVFQLVRAVTIDSTHGLLVGVAWVGLTPVACLALLVAGRVALECVAVLFRVAEHLAEIARKTPG